MISRQQKAKIQAGFDEVLAGLNDVVRATRRLELCAQEDPEAFARIFRKAARMPRPRRLDGFDALRTLMGAEANLANLAARRHR